MRHIPWILVGLLALNVGCGSSADRSDDQDEIADEERTKDRTKDRNEARRTAREGEREGPTDRPAKQDIDDVESDVSDDDDEGQAPGTGGANECVSKTSHSCDVCVATKCCEESLSPPPQSEMFACVSKNCSVVCGYY